MKTDVKQPGGRVNTVGSASDPNAARQVLLVEDSRAIATVLAARIDTLEGVTCVHSPTYGGAKALLEAEAGKFFLAVLDLNLPDSADGQIIDLVEGYGIPIVVLTGNLDENLRDSMYQRGVADYVVKDSLVGIEYVARLVSRLANSHEAKVLVVDDSRAFRDYLVSLLVQHGYQTVAAGDGEAGLAALQADTGINLVIADYNMPKMDGLTMVAEMRKLRSHDELAIVAISDSTKPGLLARFLKGGASDYLHKPFAVEEFYCRIDQNIDMLRSVRRALDLANRDFLTGLYNRRYFFEQAEQLYARAKDGDMKIVLAMIDADRFKRINDEHGHQTGDAALVAIAGALRESLCGKGLIARFGGEEFVLLRTIRKPAEANECLETIRQAIADIELLHDANPVSVTVSIGATWRLGASLDEMLRRADLAVYEAKSAGRNRVVMT